MKKNLSTLALIVIGMLIISACKSQQPINPNLVSPEVKPADTVGPDGQKIITLADQAKTINLAVGEDFLLKLGEDYSWEVTTSDQNVLDRVRNIAVVRGAQGVYKAQQAGTVTLSATGNPQCLQAQPPCGNPSIQFTVTFIVK